MYPASDLVAITHTNLQFTINTRYGTNLHITNSLPAIAQSMREYNDLGDNFLTINSVDLSLN